MSRWLLPFALVAALISLLYVMNRPGPAAGVTPSPLPVEHRPGDRAEDLTLASPELPDARSDLLGAISESEATGGPDFDPRRLAVPNVLLIDENTDRPLKRAICEVTDANGIALIAETDDAGKLLTDEALLVGPVTLSVLDRTQRSRLRAIDLPDRPKSFVFEESPFPFQRASIPVKEGLHHAGDPARPDLWKMCERRWVPIESTGAPLDVAAVELVIGASGNARFTFTRSALVPSREGLDESLMRVSDDAFPLVLEAQQSWSVVGKGAEPMDPHPWSRQRVDEPVAGRVLRAVQFLTQEVLVAEADANVVPHFHGIPLRLEFAPLVERDAQRIRELYGETLGQRIIDHLMIEDPSKGPVDAVAGTVISESGEFHGRVYVAAYPVGRSPSGGLPGSTPMVGVDWRLGPSGSWIGSFEFPGLASVEHRFELTAPSHHVIAPTMAKAHPPHEFEAGAFVVRDLLEYIPIVLRLLGPDGAPARSYSAELKSDHAPSRTTWGSAPLSPGGGTTGTGLAEFKGLTLAENFPWGFRFEVTVESRGHENLTLTQDEFRFDGTSLVCESSLASKAESAR